MKSGEHESRWGAVEQPCKPCEHRAHPRLRCKGTAEVHLYPADITYDGTLADLCLGGCCVQVSKPVEEPPGTHVEVYLRVMGTTVQVTGVLCHVRDQVRAGIQFTGLSSRKREEIHELMDELFEEVRETPVGASARSPLKTRYP